MKILELTHFSEGACGVWVRAKEESIRLAKKGHEILILSSNAIKGKEGTAPREDKIGKIKIKMTDGALINYAPLEEMGKYFKNKDLNRVRFDELKNVMIFNGGKMLLPFMTINTTLGTINIMGFQTLDYDMSYDIQVPIKLVAGAALNSLFSAKKGDDKKEDKVKKGGKVKYITLHISGSADDYKFKLGKKHVLVAPPGFNVD